MDEKIEEMVLAVYPWLNEVPIEERKQLRENVSGLMVMERLYNAGYRKESDTAREILTLIKNGVELNSMIDGDAKIAIMNELRWAGQKYGINFTNS